MPEIENENPHKAAEPKSFKASVEGKTMALDKSKMDFAWLQFMLTNLARQV